LETLSGPEREAWVEISSDERWLVRFYRQRFEVMPSSGGDWKALASSNFIQFAVTPDGTWLYYHGADREGRHRLFRVAIGGGPPEQMGDFPDKGGIGDMQISPDGRRVVTASYDAEKGFEVWALENFVPVEAKR